MSSAKCCPFRLCLNVLNGPGLGARCRPLKQGYQLYIKLTWMAIYMLWYFAVMQTLRNNLEDIFHQYCPCHVIKPSSEAMWPSFGLLGTSFNEFWIRIHTRNCISKRCFHMSASLFRIGMFTYIFLQPWGFALVFTRKTHRFEAAFLFQWVFQGVSNCCLFCAS